MKKVISIFILLFFFSNSESIAQKTKVPKLMCSSKSEITSNRTVTPHDLHTFRYETGEFCVRVRIHEIKKNEAIIDDQKLRDQIDNLNTYFSSNGNSGISFIADDIIEEHEFSSILNGPLIVLDQGTNTLEPDFSQIIDINAIDDPNRIDLFFSTDNLGIIPEIGGSVAYGIADRPIAFIANFDLDSPVIAHEVGHILGLFHTYHGTIGNGGIVGVPENNDGFTETVNGVVYSLHEPECATNFPNNREKGDYVEDTKVDRGDGNYSYGLCQGVASGTPVYCGELSEYPTIQLTNFMRSSNDFQNIRNCWSQFSGGQMGRMKYFLKYDLENISVDCPEPEECSLCRNSNYYAHEILFGETETLTFPPSEPTKHIELSNNSVSFNMMPLFDPPRGLPACEYDFSVMIPGTTNFVPLNSLMGQTRNFIGDSTLSLKVYLDGEPVCCYQIDADTIDPLDYSDINYNVMNDLQTCPTDPIDDCEDCSTFAANTINSLSEDPNDCRSREITAPNFGDCIENVTVYWGDGNVSNLTSGNTLNHNYNNGDYEVRIKTTPTDGLTCSETQIIQVNCSIDDCNPCPLEPPTFTWDSASFPNCGTTFTVDNFDPGCADIDSFTFEWKFDGVIEGYGTSIEFTDYILDRYIKVKLTATYDSGSVTCSSTKFKVAYLFSPCSRRINVFPNPSKSNSELQFDGVDAKDVQSIEILDLFGNSKMKIKPSQNSFKVPQLQSGLYIVTFYTSKGIEQKKLIIE